MVAAVLMLFGWLAVAGGAGLVAAALAGMPYAPASSGVAAFLVGLLLVALGAIVDRLDRLADRLTPADAKSPPTRF